MKVLIVLFVVLLSSTGVCEPTLLWSRKTEWGKVQVRENGPIRTLVFSTEDGETEESRMVTSDPTRPTLEYIQQMLALTAVWEANRAEPARPYRFLVVGLGGASLSNALTSIFPKSEVVSVEIEPAVVEAARDYFFYHESELVITVVDDARAFLVRNEERFDVIFLDAFDGTGVPPSLRTLEFARVLDRNLAEGGAVIANVHFTPREPSLRYQKSLNEVFPHSYLTVGVAQGIGMYTRHPVFTRMLWAEIDRNEERFRLPLRDLLEGRHQESLEGITPFRDGE